MHAKLYFLGYLLWIIILILKVVKKILSKVKKLEAND